MKRYNNIPGAARGRRLMALAVALLSLGACATAPKTMPKDAGDGAGIGAVFAPLDPGGLVYLYADIPGTRPILDRASFAGFSGKQSAELLDRTDVAVAALYPPEVGERRFMAAARGRYPSFRAGMAFSFTSSWKKRRSETGARYWHSDREGLSVSLNAKSALVSDGDPFPRSGNPELPPALDELGRGAVLAGWIPDAAEPLNRFISALEIPIQIPAERMLFALYPAPERDYYEAALRLETPTASHARALSSMLAMLRFALSQSPPADTAGTGALLAALFANPPLVDEAALILKSAAMKSETIALLFNMFSIYSH